MINKGPSQSGIGRTLPTNVRLVSGRLIPWVAGRLSGMGRRAAAVTLGRTIVVHPETSLSERLLRHELTHVAQWSRNPFLFPIRYTLAHLRHGYAANPFEVEAREAEAAPPAHG